MQTYDIPWFSLAIVTASVLPVTILVRLLGLKLSKNVWLSVARMVAQLVLLGLYLEFLFKLNNPFVNILYLALMVFAASLTSIQNTIVKWRKLLPPIFVSALLSFSVYLLFFNLAVVGIDLLFDARYLIPLGGMLLGNSLKSNIVALNAFAKSAKENEATYFQYIGFGGSPSEAVQPFLRESLRAAFQPTIANTATIGLVTIPGMMTGQVIAGSSPMLAIKYQIAIIIGILVNSFFGIVVQAFVLKRVMFDERAVLRKELYKTETMKKSKSKNK